MRRKIRVVVIFYSPLNHTIEVLKSDIWITHRVPRRNSTTPAPALTPKVREPLRDTGRTCSKWPSVDSAKTAGQLPVSRGYSPYVTLYPFYCPGILSTVLVLLLINDHGTQHTPPHYDRNTAEIIYTFKPWCVRIYYRMRAKIKSTDANIYFLALP
jgi:hypothetical protein